MNDATYIEDTSRLKAFLVQGQCVLCGKQHEEHMLIAPGDFEAQILDDHWALLPDGYRFQLWCCHCNGHVTIDNVTSLKLART